MVGPSRSRIKQIWTNSSSLCRTYFKQLRGILSNGAIEIKTCIEFIEGTTLIKFDPN